MTETTTPGLHDFPHRLQHGHLVLRGADLRLGVGLGAGGAARQAAREQDTGRRRRGRPRQPPAAPGRDVRTGGGLTVFGHRLSSKTTGSVGAGVSQEHLNDLGPERPDR
ncbi:hypothetical protein [Actinomadura algeriensis]|uniref:Uncharacterized protein n=1 Tax=Actinomadura algeriensis TaxID=1679523 RepID=A0ABR9JTZ4_9ACTN|nr:hypothetical protein [Actinomadura algeriensis]MBE1533836.1 hypothetical protein [Actinomadura algeriensis]